MKFTLGNRTLADAKATLDKYQNLRLQRKLNGETDYLVLDSHLGWQNVPSIKHPRWPYSTNALGNRRSGAGRHNSALPKFTVAIAGNSYVHGDESSDEDTWVWQLQERLGSDVHVHNLGVTAYSTDQSYLRLRQFERSIKLDLAILTITSTDIFRNLNMCRALMANDFEVPLFKPRFVDTNGQLKLVHPPSASYDKFADMLDDPAILGLLRQFDYFFPTPVFQTFQILRRFRVPVPNVWQRYFHDGISLTTKICKDFLDWTEAKGITPAILLLPVFWGAFPAGRDFDVLAKKLSRITHVIDARQAFTPEQRALPRDVLHHRFNHYTRLSGGWLAETIGEKIEQILKDKEAR